MSNESTNNTSEETISLDSQAGLSQFRSHYEEQYIEFLEAARELEGDHKQITVIEKGKNAYQTLQAATQSALETFVRDNQLSLGQTEDIQVAYNDFAEAYLSVTEPTNLETNIPAQQNVNEAEKDDIGPLYAIGQKFKRLQSKIHILQQQYAAAVADSEDTSVVSLTYNQLVEYEERIIEHLASITKTNRSDTSEVTFLTDESLEIEAGLVRVDEALHRMLPNALKTAEPIKKKNLANAFSEKQLSAESILTPDLLADPQVKELIQEYASSPVAFEASLWRLIKKIEEPSKLDKVLGVTHGSIFKSILRGMTVAEIEQFLILPGEQIRAALLEMQIEDGVQYDYRVFVTWMDEYKLMTSVVEAHPEMLFEELLAITELVKQQVAQSQ